MMLTHFYQKKKKKRTSTLNIYQGKLVRWYFVCVCLWYVTHAVTCIFVTYIHTEHTKQHLEKSSRESRQYLNMLFTNS